MEILITGGAGFIGSHLAACMINLGHNVILCDLPGKFSQHHLDTYNTVECDVSDFSQVSHLPRVDAIYHLAAQVGTASSLKNVHKDLSWNAHGTLNITQFAIDTGVSVFVYASSMAVYGNVLNALETSQVDPISPYGISKMCGEQYVKYAQSKSHKMRCTTFRIFNCYGPGQSTKNLTQSLASIFLEQVKSGNKVDVTGSLSRRRDLIYINDVIDALKMPLDDEEMMGTFNLCSGEKTSIQSLIELIIKVSKKDPNIFTVTNTGGIPEDPHDSGGDNSKLRKLGWDTVVPLEAGLKICWDDMNE